MAKRSGALQWSKVDVGGTSPRGRSDGSAILLEDRLWLFGGSVGPDSIDDFDVLDLAAGRFEQVKAKGTPCRRHGHSAFAWRGQMGILFGNQDGMALEGEEGARLHLFDPRARTFSWVAPGGTPPEPRYRAGTLLHGDVLFLAAGNADDFYNRDDLAVLDLVGMRWLAVEVGGEIEHSNAPGLAVHQNHLIRFLGAGAYQGWPAHAYALDLAGLDVAAGRLTGTWRPIPIVPPPDAKAFEGLEGGAWTRSVAPAIRTEGGLLVAGGWQMGASVSHALALDPVVTFSFPDLSRADASVVAEVTGVSGEGPGRFALAAVAGDDSRAYIFGGYSAPIDETVEEPDDLLEPEDLWLLAARP